MIGTLIYLHGHPRGRELRRNHPGALLDPAESSAPAHALQPHATRLRARVDSRESHGSRAAAPPGSSRFWSFPRRSAASSSHVGTTYERRVERPRVVMLSATPVAGLTFDLCEADCRAPDGSAPRWSRSAARVGWYRLARRTSNAWACRRAHRVPIAPGIP